MGGLTSLLKSLHRPLEGRHHLIIHLLNLRPGITNRPGAGHIMAVTAAHRLRKEIKDNRLTQLERVAFGAATVGETRIPPLGEDHAGAFQFLVEQFPPDEAFDIADG